MLDDQPVFGFDGVAGGDMTLVVLRRDGDHWQVESSDGPEHCDLSRVVARIVGDRPPPAPRPQADDRPWVEVVEEWMAKHQGSTFQFTDWQRQVIQASFEKLVAEGKIRLR